MSPLSSTLMTFVPLPTPCPLAVRAANVALGWRTGLAFCIDCLEILELKPPQNQYIFKKS